MAKKQTPSEQSHTLSTRLSAKQKKAIEDAAETLLVSPAKFIRMAALRYAQDTLQSQPPNDQAIRELAREVSEKLTSVKGTVYSAPLYEEQVWQEKTVTISDGSFSFDQMRNWGFDPDHSRDASRIDVHMLSKREINDLVLVLSESPTAFAEALATAIRQPAVQKPRFKPLGIDLNDTDDD